MTKYCANCALVEKNQIEPTARMIDGVSNPALLKPEKWNETRSSKADITVNALVLAYAVPMLQETPAMLGSFTAYQLYESNPCDDCCAVRSASTFMYDTEACAVAATERTVASAEMRVTEAERG